MSKAELLAGLIDANGDVLATNLDNVSVAFSEITSKPTTLAGYGITDAATSAQGTNADTAYGWGDHSAQGYATTTYVDTSVSNLVAAAPTTLDTLNELAAALGDDANFSTTVTNSLALKANSADLATVATTGAYSDLSGTPTIPTLSTLGIDNHDDITVDVSGNVGIGTASPDTSNKLTIDNGSNAYGLLIKTASASGSSAGFKLAPEGTNQFFCNANTSGNTTMESVGYMDFRTNNATRFRMETDGDFHADGDVIAYSTTISDERLKTNIQGIENAVAKVSQLNGYTFEYTADGKVSAGVIAQEVEAVLPEAVSEKQLPLKADDDQEYKVVNYDALHGLLIEAVKELAERVEALEAK